MLVRHYQSYPTDQQGCVIALGNFDGVHKGHQAILNQTNEIAKHTSAPSTVMTFEPHPVSYFKPNIHPFRLTSTRTKYRLLKQLGIDVVCMQSFNKAFAELSGEDFVKTVLSQHLAASHVVIGYDYIFGHNRSGNAELLKELAPQYGYKVTQLEAASHDQGSIIYSSTTIRELIRLGQIEQANKLLGHNFTIEGRVCHGHKRGRTIGFPTANLKLKDYIQPQFGVYAVTAIIDGVSYQAVANIGVKPTVGGDEAPLLEVHIFDFDQEIYGKHIQISLHHFIRNEQSFESFDILRQQIEKDADSAREYFSHESI